CTLQGARLLQAIDRRMDTRQLCGSIGIQKRMMRIEAAVEALRQRYVEQVSQPAEARTPPTFDPASPIPGPEVSTDEDPVRDVADWEICPTPDDGERRGVSPPVGPQA